MAHPIILSNWVKFYIVAKIYLADKQFIIF